MLRRALIGFYFLLLVLGLARLVPAQEDVAELEEQAIQNAVARVAPSVVRIETFGGLERVGGFLVGDGPTSGLIVGADGWIVASAFNFVQQPNSILVTLPKGNRAAAKIVARDHSRMLVLLKVDTAEPLPVPEAAPLEEMAVGQWTIAVGRTFAREEPNVSIGILSALGRIWGRAIQTDAKVSPSNYGGSLVDIRGRVMGILVPLAPESQNEVAGAEWYDSGIGFAIPLAAVQQRMSQLQAGEDLYSGLLGINLAGQDIYSTKAELASVRFRSPADEAGLEVGDTIVEIDGVPVAFQMHLKHALGTRYAGEKVQLTLLRDGKRIAKQVELTDKLEPYEHPFVGILPARRASADQAGVVIRYVYPESGAAAARVKAGDGIVSIDNEPVENAEALRLAVANARLGQNIVLGVDRNGQTQAIEVTLRALPTSVPDHLPDAVVPRPENTDAGVETGAVEIKIPEEPNDCLLLVPDDYDPGRAHGVLVHLPVPGEFDRQAFEERWLPICNEQALLILAPQPEQPNTWLPTELDFIRKTLKHVTNHYRVDRTRIVVHGYQSSGTLAFLVGFRQRDLVRGLVVVDASLPARLRPPDNDPVERMALFLAIAEESRVTARAEASAEVLQAMKYPVTSKELTGPARPLNDTEFAEVLRWIDTLDRI